MIKNTFPCTLLETTCPCLITPGWLKLFIWPVFNITTPDSPGFLAFYSDLKDFKLVRYKNDLEIFGLWYEILKDLAPSYLSDSLKENKPTMLNLRILLVLMFNVEENFKKLWNTWSPQMLKLMWTPKWSRRGRTSRIRSDVGDSKNMLGNVSRSWSWLNRFTWRSLHSLCLFLYTRDRVIELHISSSPALTVSDGGRIMLSFIQG